MAQSVFFPMTSGVATPTATIGRPCIDTVTESVVPVEFVNRLGMWKAEFDDAHSGTFDLSGYSDGNSLFVSSIALKGAAGNYFLEQPANADNELLRLSASGATGTVQSVDNANGTFSLTFYDTDGVTQLSTATFTTATGDRTRTS